MDSGLDALSARARQFLGCRHAILGGAMSWVSERHLVAAISEAGGFGVLACGSMGPDALAAEIAATRARTARPFGVNLIVMHPQLAELVAVCAAGSITHVVLAGGVPSGATIAAVRRFARAIAFAPSAAIGRRLIRGGVEALVIEGSEAGGHVGPVSLTVLAQEILPVVTDVPVFVAGGLGRGEAIAAFLRMGAAGAQLGTRFAAARESIAHPAFKRAFLRAAARDAVTSVQLDPRFPVIPVRALANAGARRFVAAQADAIRRVDAGEITREAAQLEIEHFWAGALRRAVIDGDVEEGSVMAGQSVGLVTAEQSVSEIVAELVAQAEAALSGVRGVPVPTPQAA